jgi:hypothetical protein
VLARLKRIVMTPTVLAILFGLSWSALELPTHGLIITPLLGAANYISLALVLMVALLNGLSLDRIPIRQNAMTVLCCAVLLLLVEPLLVYAIDDLGDAARRERQLSFILSAMPSSNSTIAFAIRYGCDARLAATLVTTTAILSAISLPTLMASFHLFNQ